ncbi:APC family permease [Nocardioides sp.]|uniref:APC family permease n=1 Tax=Nocardioides sp. TaxID=35761 RepID=UPI002719BED6|nr:APC family permease [Nocardioides sp.]MDO9458289.1 APC family permease [Nocardioides sp.]
MTDISEVETAGEESGLKRTITGRLLFFYVLGDVLGSGIYVLIGAVAGEVGGAFWIAFLIGVSIATITGAAYAELVTKFPQAAGAALFVNKAFKSRILTFLVTVSMLSACFAASGSLATGFASYFDTVWSLPPAILVSLGLIVLLTIVNYLGITESVVANLVMTIVEITGLVVVLLIAVVNTGKGDSHFDTLTDFSTNGNEIFAVVAGVALAFFAMTGFENAANVAEEVVDPAKHFPRALVGGMLAAGVIYVLVAMSAALVVDVSQLASSDAPLLDVVESGVLPISVSVLSIVFAIIAMTAITNTTLVSVVTQSRILYGMAREDVVPGAFAKIHQRRRSPVLALLFCAAVVMGLLLVGWVLNETGAGIDVVDRLATVTVVFTLFIYSLVIVAAFKLRGEAETEENYHAPTPVLVLGLVGNAVLLVYVVVDDPGSLLWVGGLLMLGLVLFLVEYAFGDRTRPEGARRGEPSGR